MIREFQNTQNNSSCSCLALRSKGFSEKGFISENKTKQNPNVVGVRKEQRANLNHRFELQWKPLNVITDNVIIRLL